MHRQLLGLFGRYKPELERTRRRGLATLPAKTISSERRIALPVSCVTSLRAHRARQAQEKETAGPDWQGSSYVFLRPDGHPIEPATLTRHFNALLRDAPPPPIGFHDIRHSTATLLLEQGVNLVVINEFLGHAHIGVTATVYAHVRLQRQAIDLPGHTIGNLAPQPSPEPDDGPPRCAAPVRRRCRQLLPSDTQEALPETDSGRASVCNPSPFELRGRAPPLAIVAVGRRPLIRGAYESTPQSSKSQANALASRPCALPRHHFPHPNAVAGQLLAQGDMRLYPHGVDPPIACVHRFRHRSHAATGSSPGSPR
ncbi:tyrosine-type recombinase/integrase [Streptomyces sp. NPDC006703]|uniref:tyrosine-type recombinase/integrase n=1 Tax=Streptomyces sp. NPDC006703 TaxID=3364759 RepID=UPI0036B97E38